MNESEIINKIQTLYDFSDQLFNIKSRKKIKPNSVIILFCDGENTCIDVYGKIEIESIEHLLKFADILEDKMIGEFIKK